MKRSALKRSGWIARGKWKPMKRAELRRTRPLPSVNRKRRGRQLAAYRAHLASPYWKALRKLVFERDGYRCVDCGEEAGYFTAEKRDLRGLECDHLHYRTWLHETPKDCATRCRACHRKRHAGQWWKRLPGVA